MNATMKAGAGAVTVLTAVVGGVAMFGAGSAAAFAGIGALSYGESTTDRADVTGVTGLNVDVSAMSLSIEFFDEDQARLDIRGGNDPGLRMRVDDAELRVYSDDGLFDWFSPGWLRDDTSATLYLPRSMAGVDADLTLQAGELKADGEFGELGLTVNAGEMQVDAAARSVDGEVNAGRAELVLGDVRSAELSVSAGRLTAELTSTPDSVVVDASAGELMLTVPDGQYDLRQDTTAGSIDSDLQVDRSSSNRIDASVSAGSIRLRAAD